MAHCHILPFGLDPSPMRIDQLAYDAVNDDYSIRFYTWPVPTVSIGRFQTLSEERIARLAAHGIPWVRRPTGGQAILHQGDLTFSVVGPLKATQQHHLLHTYHLIAQGLISGLAALNITAETVINESAPTGAKGRPDACYGFTSQADLRVDGQKLVGCAQVRRRKAFLQQGVVYLKAPRTLYTRLFQEAVPLVDLDQLTGKHLQAETVAEALGKGLTKALQNT